MQVKLRIYVSKHLSHSEWLVILTCYFSGVYFMRLTIKGGLQFLFLYFIERYRWRSVFPWLRFVDQTLSHSIFFSITCTSVTGGIMINRRQLYSGAELGGCQGGHCPPKILPGPPVAPPKFSAWRHVTALKSYTDHWHLPLLQNWPLQWLPPNENVWLRPWL